MTVTIQTMKVSPPLTRSGTALWVPWLYVSQTGIGDQWLCIYAIFLSLLRPRSCGPFVENWSNQFSSKSAKYMLLVYHYLVHILSLFSVIKSKFLNKFIIKNVRADYFAVPRKYWKTLFSETSFAPQSFCLMNLRHNYLKMDVTKTDLSKSY